MAAQLLVVTSDATLRDVVQRSVVSLGHQAVGVPGHLEAERALTRVAFDALCLDSITDQAEKLYAEYQASVNGHKARLLYIGPPAARLVRSTLPASLRDAIDAFVTKPVDNEMLANALLRVLGNRRKRVGSADLLRIDGVTLDRATRRIHFSDGGVIDLTPVEHKLLRFLMEQAGEYVSKPDLLEHVWGYPADGGSELVRAHISNLRRKLRSQGRDALLRTMPYHGYAFVPDGLE